jgi:hypothetical protein
VHVAGARLEGVPEGEARRGIRGLEVCVCVDVCVRVFYVCVCGVCVVCVSVEYMRRCNEEAVYVQWGFAKVVRVVDH